MEVPTTPKPAKRLGGTLSSSPLPPSSNHLFLHIQKNLQYSNLCTSISLVESKTLDLMFKSKWFIQDFGSNVQEKVVHPLASYRSNALDKICL